ncbi:MAG: hypothetical protein JSU63_10745 [Phycisphaerales bacterium]|nr:MAG: hypothetical protein JSU63_10745 [Phycisphaerales bacterium]
MTTKALEAYDNQRFGPIVGISDEGSAAKTIARAAYMSAKALALGDEADEMCVGMIIDGERMGSAGEIPIGPDEYDQLVPVAGGWTFSTTNVGVRVNTRIHQPLPEFAVADAQADEQRWLDSIFARFRPFIHTPDGKPRPLTVRLLVKTAACVEAFRNLAPKIESGRRDSRLGSPSLHRLSFLIEFDRVIKGDDVGEIRKLMQAASELKVPEVAVDGRLLEGARRRISIQGLLNVMDAGTTRELLKEGERLGVRLVYHYEVDEETAARTIWTGLHTARAQGLTAAKYGLFPMKFDQQREVVHDIQRWLGNAWTAIPAYYVDTALVTDNDVCESDRCVEGCRLWMNMIAEAGVKVALIDCPDRIDPHKLLKTGGPNDRGILTLEDVGTLTRHAETLGLKALWSGGIRPNQAFELGKLGVAGIFTTGSTARPRAVSGTMEGDHQLSFQGEPTGPGVRRIHALVGGGFLCRVLEDKSVVKEIEGKAATLIDSRITELESPLEAINETLQTGWKKHWVLVGS